MSSTAPGSKQAKPWEGAVPYRDRSELEHSRLDPAAQPTNMGPKHSRPWSRKGTTTYLRLPDEEFDDNISPLHHDGLEHIRSRLPLKKGTTSYLPLPDEEFDDDLPLLNHDRLEHIRSRFALLRKGTTSYLPLPDGRIR